MLFCSLADVGQIFSRNMMHDAESFCFMSYLENFFSFQFSTRICSKIRLQKRLSTLDK